MEINKVTRKIRLDSKHNAIKYQLITELVFLRKQSIIESDLVYLALLVEWGPISLKQFCNNVVVYLHGEDAIKDVEKYPVRVQNVRNRMSVLEKRGLVQKDGKGKKTISFNSSIVIQSTANILLEYNFLYLETEESKKPSTRVSQEVATL
jgi:hypothetical protein